MNYPVRNVCLIAGEASGDQLGADLMRALREARPDIIFTGVGGPLMIEQGLKSLFDMTDINVMGFLPVVKRLPLLLKRIEETAAAIVEREPDVVVLIDAPDFTHRVARKLRTRRPDIPIVDYVSPTVWAWRPGRAKRMRAYVDHLMALLPFEPAAHQRLGGPPCTYVGHPLVNRLTELRPGAAERDMRNDLEHPTLLVLPGSRRSEIHHLMPVFGQTVSIVHGLFPGARFILPAVQHVRAVIEEELAAWDVKPEIVTGEEAKWRAFRQARSALAASGTVTLELALAGIPAVVGYKVSRVEEFILRRLVTVSSAVLPNIILGEAFVPEFLQDDCSADHLSAAWALLIGGTEARRVHLEALDRVEEAMRVPGGKPSALAAGIVLGTANNKKGA